MRFLFNTVYICFTCFISPVLLLRQHQRRAARAVGALRVGSRLGDAKHTVRGYCLDIPRFEESLNYKNTTQQAI